MSVKAARESDKMMDMTTFLQAKAQTTRNATQALYLDNVLSSIQLNPRLLSDIQTPAFLQKYLRLQKVGLTIWGEFQRKPTFNHKERYVCVVHGGEKFRLVNAIFKQNMYSGVFDNLDPLETPVNLFETNQTQIDRYQLMRVRDVFEATVPAGGCVYVPAYYWWQTQTTSPTTAPGTGESVLVTFEFESSSQLVDEIITALDKGILDE